MKEFKRIKIFEILLIVILIGLLFANFYSLLLIQVSRQTILVLLSILFITPGSLRAPFLIYRLRNNEKFIFPTDNYKSFRKGLYFLIPSLFVYLLTRVEAFNFEFAWTPYLVGAILIFLVFIMVFVEGKESTFDFLELDEDYIFISNSDFTKGYELIFPRDHEHIQIEEDKIVLRANRKRFSKLGLIFGAEREDFTIPFGVLENSDLVSLLAYLKSVGLVQVKPKGESKDL